MKIYYPTSYLKTYGHILCEMLRSNLRPDCRYLRYLRFIGLRVEKKTVDDIFVASIANMLC